MSDLKQAALDYHALPKPGKLSTCVTKATDNQHDLSLAYSPGVAEPVKAIFENPDTAYTYTGKGNLVAVITDGSAVLGLGAVGPLASKPVMEGKAVLFKRFADIDVFDLEVAAESPQAFIETVVRIAPTFGGINLEDIKGPECFEIEKILSQRLDIPVFHDDQHGTAVVSVAGLLNALEVQGKSLQQVKIVCLGAGAAGIATAELLMSFGVPYEHIYMVDRKGGIHPGRRDLNQYKARFAKRDNDKSLAETCVGADVFLGVSSANLMTVDMLKSMAANPIVFALANPDPEIPVDVALATRQDVLIATGRSDYPNQVNNVLCFPYMFRGALDVRARCIHPEMLKAAVHAIRDLARQPVPEVVLEAYPDLKSNVTLSKEYILPKATDPRLKEQVSAAVAKAAIHAGVARLGYPAHYSI